MNILYHRVTCIGCGAVADVDDEAFVSQLGGETEVLCNKCSAPPRISMPRREERAAPRWVASAAVAVSVASAMFIMFAAVVWLLEGRYVLGLLFCGGAAAQTATAHLLDRKTFDG